MRRLQIATLAGVEIRPNRSQIGIPPATRTPQVATQADGSITIGGQPIPPAPLPVSLYVPSQASAAAETPAPTTDTDNTGEAVTVPLVFAATGEVIALRRPNGRRISLLIQNLSVAGNIFYCFDRAADGTTCIAIGALGNRLFDKAIPQGDLHIFSTGPGTVILEVINK